MGEVLFIIGYVIFFIWFCFSKYAPETLWGKLLFLGATCIFTPVITFPIQFNSHFLGIGRTRHALVDTQYQCDDNR